jgi:hypothetical protein
MSGNSLTFDVVGVDNDVVVGVDNDPETSGLGD